METCVILKQLKIKQEWVEMESRNLANVSQIWALLSPPNVKAVNTVGLLHSGSCWEAMGLENRCCKKERLHVAFQALAKNETCVFVKGSDPRTAAWQEGGGAQDIVCTHRLTPRAENPEHSAPRQPEEQFLSVSGFNLLGLLPAQSYSTTLNFR